MTARSSSRSGVPAVAFVAGLALGMLAWVAPSAYAAGVDRSQRVAPLALIPNANTVRMAWIGTPAQRSAAGLMTLQAALNAAPAGQVVSFDPDDYAFTTRLTVPRPVTLETTSPSILYAQFTVSGSGLTADPEVRFGASATGAVVTANAAGAVLDGITVVNPNAVLRPTGIQLGASATGVAINDFTMDGGGQPSSFGVNLTTGSATITNATISGVSTGVGITASSTAGGIAVTGGSFAATVAGIALGTAVAPTISGVTVSGPGAAGTGIDLANSSGATITSPLVTGFARGIGATTTSTGAGPRITDANISGTSKEGIALGSTTGATVVTPTITGDDTAQSIGINLYRATSVTLDRVTVSHFSYGVFTNIGDTGAGPTIISPRISEVSSGGITLGSTQGATITNAILNGAGSGSGTGINVTNAGRVTVSVATINGFGNGVASQSRAGRQLRPRRHLPERTLNIIGTPTASTGISLLGAANATITDIRADVTGGGVVLHDCTGVQVRNLTVIGHEGPTATSGAAILKAYDTQNVSVDHSSIDTGSYGLFFQRTDTATITDATVANVVEYGIYGRSVANLDVSGSTFTDNRAVGNLFVIDPAASISHDINIHNNVMTGNRGGLNLYTGTSAVRFTNNTVTGQPYVISAAPAHDVLIADNTITLPQTGGEAAVMVTPLFEDGAQPGSYSSSGIQVRDNTFTGSGTALQVGSPDPTSPDAARRTLRDPVLVIGNTFPAASTAVLTYPNAVVGADVATTAATLSTVATGPVAVDARDYDDPNDWGSVCRATGYLDGNLVYAGQGAAVYELTVAPVLYPTNCVELSLTEHLDAASGTVLRTGDLLTWTLTPRNDGLRDAPAGWTVTQLLPDGVQLVAITGAGYTFHGLTATATDPLATGTDGPVITVQVRIVANPVADTTMKDVAYIAPLAPANATDLDADGYPDVIVEHLSPLTIPTLATDTDASPTDNDAQGSWTVQQGSAGPIPTPGDHSANHRPGLAQTGTNFGPLANTALLLITGGTLALILARRRYA